MHPESARRALAQRAAHQLGFPRRPVATLVRFRSPPLQPRVRREPMSVLRAS